MCLGHQIIGHVFGAEVKKGKRPVHGKVHKIKNSGENIFKNLPKKFNINTFIFQINVFISSCYH